MYKIIITVPHSVCFEGDTRLEKNCDTSALNFANILYDDLIKHKYDTTLIKPEFYNRKFLDPNRFATMSKEFGVLTIKNSDMWENLNKNIKEHYKINKTYDDILVFDVHSFPNGSFKVDADIVILDNFPYQEITQELSSFLQEKKYKTALLAAGTGRNALIDVLTSGPVYIKALLIEINEKLLDEDLRKISNEFVKFLEAKRYHNDYLKHKNNYLKLAKK